MKKLLLISKVFSSNAPGRVEKFSSRVEYLSKKGWQTIIVAPKDPGFCFYDNFAKNAYIKPKIFITSFFFAGARKIYYKLFYNPKESEGNIKNKKSEKSTFLKGLCDAFKNIGLGIKSYIFFPDAWVSWFPFASSIGKQVIKRENIDLIYSSCYPFTSHLVALKLKQIFNKKWIAEFRDPWVNNPSIKKSKLWIFISSFLEKLVIEEADKIIIYKGWFPGGRDYFINKYSKINNIKNKVVELPYVGFDEESFKDVGGTRSDKFTIIYAGNFYGGNQSLITFFEAVKEIIENNEIPINRIQILLIGNFRSDCQRFIHRLKTQGVVKYIKAMPHREVVKYLVGSDVGLWVIDAKDSNNENIPSKVFDYIGARIHILSLVPNGPGADFIRDNNFGSVINPSSVGEVKLEIIRLYNLFNEGNLIFRGNSNNFSRIKSEVKFKEVLDRAMF